VGLGFTAMVMAGALLLGAPPAMAGDASGSAMTTTQARRAYLKAVCPVDDAIEALMDAESVPDATWATVQPLVQQVADEQVREADRLTHPKKPWPADVREYIPAVAELQLIQSGSNDVLAGAASLEEYNALIKELVKGLPAPVKAHLKSFMKAKVMIRKRLGLPKNRIC
jgi:hypothetical protein